MNRILILLSLTYILSGCGRFDAELSGPPKWTKPVYDSCLLNVNSSASIPFKIGLTTHRFDLKYRYDSMNSHRATIINTDNTSEDIGSPIAIIPGQMLVNFNSWSPDGNLAYLTVKWEDPDLGMCSDYYGGGCDGTGLVLVDTYRYDLTTKRYKNLTSVERVSDVNSGAMTLYNDPTKLIFSAMIAGQNKPYVMNLDGTNKEPLSSSAGYIYGINISPDGTKYAFHADYKIVIGDMTTKEEIRVNSGCNFNFAPTWSKDSQHIVFACGVSHIGPDIAVADRNGRNVRIVGTRQGFSGTVPFMYGYDWHGGGSDWFLWLADSKTVVYARKIGLNIELYRSDINTGIEERITFGPEGSRSNYPSLSFDGRYLAFVRFNQNKSDLYIMDLVNGQENKITDISPNCGIKYPYWSPN